MGQRLTLRGIEGRGLPLPMRRSTGGVAALARGWNPSYDSGTAADIVVANVSGSDANPGTLAQPKATISAAISAAIAMGGQRIIRVRDEGVPYPAIDLTGWSGTASAKQRITGYSAEKPRLRGIDVVTGWTRCGAADAPALGATLGVGGSPIFKKTVTKSSLSLTLDGSAGDASSLIGIGLTEADVLLPMCKHAAASSSPHVTTNPADMHSTATYAVDGSDRLTSITLTGVIDLYTPAQLTKALVCFHGSPNIGVIVPITGASGATLNLTTTKQREAVAGVAKFSLLNILPAMTAGTFGFTDDGAGNVTLYIWPTSEANLSASIGATARRIGVQASGSSYVVVEGFDVAHFGGDANLIANGEPGTGARSVGNEFRHMRLRATPSGAAVYSYKSDSTLFDNITVEDIYTRTTENRLWRAVSWQNSNDLSVGNKARFLDIRRTEQSPLQLYWQERFLAKGVYLQDCGLGAHSNLFNAYLNSRDVVFAAIDVVNCPAFATWQRAANINFLFCRFDHSGVLPQDISIKDQGGDLPVTPTSFWIFNCGSRAAISIGAVGVVGDATINVRNCIASRVEIQNAATTETLSSHHNVLLNSGLDLGVVGPFDLQLPTAQVFDGATTNLSAGSPVIGLGGADMESRLVALEAMVGESLHFDATGAAFARADFVGPLVAARAVDVIAPTLSAPTASAASSLALTIGVTTAEARGGVYYVCTTSATAPTPAQIVAGQDAAGLSAAASGVLTNVAAGARSTTATGLTASTTYHVHWTHEDWHGNRAPVVSASATTDAAVSGIRMEAISGAYSNFATSWNIPFPAALAGDLLVIVVQILSSGPNVSLNGLPSGWSQLGGGWDGAKRLPSQAGASSKPGIWVFTKPLVAGEAGGNFTFTTAANGNITYTTHHLRGDAAISVAAHAGGLDTSLPSITAGAGKIFVAYSHTGANATEPTTAPEATQFGVAGDPTMPAVSGVFVDAYGTITSKPKRVTLLKPHAGGAVTAPASSNTLYCAYIMALV